MIFIADTDAEVCGQRPEPVPEIVPAPPSPTSAELAQDAEDETVSEDDAEFMAVLAASELEAQQADQERRHAEVRCPILPLP